MKVLGFTEENTACCLCGKTELKGTYATEDDNGTIFYLGSTCIKNKYALNHKEFKDKVKEGYNEALKAANEEYEASEEYKTKNNESEKIEELRAKYNLEKKHFKTYYRAYKI
jgi:hypothetical protein